jgi:hypothetical protein
MLGWHDRQMGNSDRVALSQWIGANVMLGGPAQLYQRAANIWGRPGCRCCEGCCVPRRVTCRECTHCCCMRVSAKGSRYRPQLSVSWGLEAVLLLNGVSYPVLNSSPSQPTEYFYGFLSK